MPVKSSIRRPVIIAVSLVVFMLLGGMAFVFYFMHAVYEVDDLLDDDEIPASVLAGFKAQYPGAAEVEWEREDDLYLAVFPWRDLEELEVYYRPDGEVEKIEQAIAYTDLPEGARQYLENKTGFKVNDKERISYSDGRVLYEVEIAGKLEEIDCIFDAAGKLVTRERDGSTLETPPGEEGE